ncbi:MAG: hypothetical protein U9R60_13320 [Bacteroidota bacterium]|nr:hypothetical protein [Bacteroidota bacterium]
MKTFKKSNWILLGTALLAVILIMSGCASKKNLWGDPETGLILKYQMPENQKISYQKSTYFTQSMEINGQEIKILADQDLYYSLLLKEKVKQDIGLGVTVDSVNYLIESPRGELIPDMSGIIGQSFNMTLTESGKEKNLDEAKEIKYSMEGEEQNIASLFMALLPDLPDNPVKIGDTWKSVDTIVEESARGNMLMIFNTFNTLEALETLDGLECVKVNAKVVGSMEGEGQEDEVQYDWDGEIEGEGTWYFAYKKGLLVKESGKGIGDGALIISAKDMSIPLTREFVVENVMIKR